MTAAQRPGNPRRGRLGAFLPAVAVGAGAAVLGSYFLPWARSGRAERSAFDLARTVDTLGLADSAAYRVLLVGFWMSPLLVGATWTVAVLGWRRTAGALCCTVGAVAAASALVVLRSSAVRPGTGSKLGIVVGMASLLAGVLLVVIAPTKPRAQLGPN